MVRRRCTDTGLGTGFMRAAGHALPSWVLGAHAPQAGQLRGETHLSSTTHLPEGQTVRRSGRLGLWGGINRVNSNALSPRIKSLSNFAASRCLRTNITVHQISETVPINFIFVFSEITLLTLPNKERGEGRSRLRAPRAQASARTALALAPRDRCCQAKPAFPEKTTEPASVC